MLLLLCAVLAATKAATPRTVLVTGATGRTDRLLYAQLKTQSDITEVRALVRGALLRQRYKQGARSLELYKMWRVWRGILWWRDDSIDIARAYGQCRHISHCSGSRTSYNETLIKAVEFTGVENQAIILPFYCLRILALQEHQITILSNKSLILRCPITLQIKTLLAFINAHDIVTGGCASNAQRRFAKWQTCYIIVFDGNYVRGIYGIAMHIFRLIMGMHHFVSWLYYCCANRYKGDPILFWKLNAETFIGYSGIGRYNNNMVILLKLHFCVWWNKYIFEIYKNVNVECGTTRNGQNDTKNTHLLIVPSAVVKPCGLGVAYGRGGKELLVK